MRSLPIWFLVAALPAVALAEETPSTPAAATAAAESPSAPLAEPAPAAAAEPAPAAAEPAAAEPVPAAAEEAPSVPAPTPTPAPPTPAAGAVERGPSWTGFASAREEYRYRRSTGIDEEDQLLRLALDAQAISPASNFELAASLGLWWRLTDTRRENQPWGLAEVRNEDLWFDVYQLNAGWKPGGALRSVKVGRIEAEHGRPATFDGLAVTLQGTSRARLFAFGGRTVHFFSINDDVFEDWIASLGGEVLFDKWKLELDWRLLKEDVPAETQLEDPERESVTNSSYGVAAWWRPSDWLNARLRLRMIDADFEQVGGAVRAEWREQRLGVEAKVDFQPSTLRQLNEFDDPYFVTLGESKPHMKARLNVFKDFETGAGDFSINLGADGRQVLEGGESRFNRNFLRGYLLLSARRIAGTGLFASAIGEIHRLKAGKGLLTAGGALGWDQKPLRAEVGTAWQRYEYVYYQTPEERSDVRSIYGDVRVDVLQWLALRARYSYEIFDRRLHTVTASVAQTF